jgi:O-antigen/teichoic acid export membrane protein
MNKAMALGATWMVGFKLLDRSVAVLSTLILARLLTPEDFGLVAMAMAVLAILELATYFSFEIALIQRADPQPSDYDAAWTMNVVLALAGSAALGLAAVPIAGFYGDSRLGPVIAMLAVGWAVSGFENIRIVDFRRELDFRRDFTFMAAKRLLSFAATMVFAFAFRSYWALVFGAVASRAFGVMLSYVMRPARPRFGLKGARRLLSFSGWMVAGNIVHAVESRVPHVIVGRASGAQALGFLTLADDIARLPGTSLIAPINRAVFPGYSRLAEDVEALRASYLRVLGVVSLVALPAAVGIACVAYPLVTVLLGEKWAPAASALEVLALAGAIQALSSNNSSAFLAIGRPRLVTTIAALRMTVLIALVAVLSAKWGFVGAAYADLITSFVALGISLPLLLANLELALRRYLVAIWRPVAASGAMAALVSWANFAVFGASTAGIGGLAGLIALGALCYLGVVTGLWWLAGRPEGGETDLLALVKQLGKNGGKSLAVG